MRTPHAELQHELEHLRLGTSVLGYNRKAVAMLLERLVDGYRELSIGRADVEGLRSELRAAQIERDELRLRVAELESGAATSRELDQLVRNTLDSAEREANQIRARAQREAIAIRSIAGRDPTRAPGGGSTGVRPMELPGDRGATLRETPGHLRHDAVHRRRREELEGQPEDVDPAAAPAASAEPALRAAYG